MHPVEAGLRRHMDAGLQCPRGPRSACTPLPAIHASAIPGENPSTNPSVAYSRVKRLGLHIPLGLLFTRGEELPVPELSVTTLGNSVFFEGFAG
jgi:hypothetical protein